MGNKRLIVVLGMHRSGTSVLTRSLECLGVNLGDSLMPGNEDNRLGFYEDLDFVNLNIAMLDAIGQKWHHLALVKETDVDLLIQAGYLQQALELLEKKCSHASVFAFKDPRTSKLMPFWSRVFEACPYALSYVVALRNPESVVSSLVKRDSFPVAKSYYLWLEHLLNAVSYTQNTTRVFLDYDRFLADPEIGLRDLASGLDLKINAQAQADFLHSFLNKELRHHQSNNASNTAIFPFAVKLYDYLVNPDSDPLQLANRIVEGRQLLIASEFAFSCIDTLSDEVTKCQNQNAAMALEVQYHKKQLETDMSFLTWCFYRIFHRARELCKYAVSRP